MWSIIPLPVMGPIVAAAAYRPVTKSQKRCILPLSEGIKVAFDFLPVDSIFTALTKEAMEADGARS